ncbi:unnamed protein product [Calypogeia fissa]
MSAQDSKDSVSLWTALQGLRYSSSASYSALYFTRRTSSTPSSLATQHLRSARPDEALDRSIPEHWDCFLEENTTRAIPLAAERFDRSKLEHWNSLI